MPRKNCGCRCTCNEGMYSMNREFVFDTHLTLKAALNDDTLNPIIESLKAEYYRPEPRFNANIKGE